MKIALSPKSFQKQARLVVVVPTHLERLDDVLAATLLHNALQLSEYKLEIVLPESCDPMWYLAFFAEHGIQGSVRQVAPKYFGSPAAVNRMGTDSDFYRMYLEFEYILICHLDAWVFRDRLAYWMDLGYDFIGAPLFLPQNGHASFMRRMAPFGCNGGLSLRRVARCIHVLDTFQPGIGPWRFTQALLFLARNRQWGFIFILYRLMRLLLQDWRGTREKYNIYEDVFFTVIAPLCGNSISLPPASTALRFACEVNYPLIQKEVLGLEPPLGIHGYDKYVEADYLDYVRGFFSRKQRHYDAQAMSAQPLVSVVMIVKNLISSGRLDTFDQAVKSVINQTYERLEIVLLDGASTDGSFALLQDRYASCRGVALHCKSDRSVWEGMSNGIELAKGELIATMNSDDYFSTSEALEIMVQKMMDANADMVYAGATLLADKRGRRFPTHFPSVLYCFGIVHQATLIKKSVIQTIEPFKEAHVTAENYLFVAILMAHFKVVRVPKSLVHYRLGGLSTSMYGGANAERTTTDYVCYMKKLTSLGHYLHDDEIRQLHGFRGMREQGIFQFIRIVLKVRDRRLRLLLLSGIWNLVRWQLPQQIKRLILLTWRKDLRRRATQSNDGASR